MKENFVECISLSKYYKGKGEPVCAIGNLNLSIGENQLVIIKGRSGAGKSTLLNLMCGLIRPTEGKVFIGNDCISELSDTRLCSLLAEKIGIIFQNFNLLPTYTVYENIETGMVPKGLNRHNIRGRVMSLLDRFGLKDKESLMPSELSSGQQQKVAIIRSLIKDPSVIFADEPTGSVDDETAADIMEHLINLKNQKQVTLVVATHGNMLEKFADRIVQIENGRILA